MSDASVIDIIDLVKTFPGVRALDGVSLSLRAGEVHGIIGENGAGKSTLMNILAGVHEPTSGQILMNGSPLPTGSWRRPTAWASCR